MVEGYCCCVVDRHCFLLLFTSCRTAVWHVGQSHAVSNYICLYSQLMCHGRTQCVYRTSYECSYVKTVAALCWVDWSLQNRRRRWWVWYNKAGALPSTWVLFTNVCCLPNVPFYHERFESRPSLGTTSMIRSLLGLGRIQQQLHFNPPPPATSCPTHTSNLAIWTNPTPHPHPLHYCRLTWCAHSAPSYWSIPDQFWPNTTLPIPLSFYPPFPSYTCLASPHSTFTCDTFLV
jgi:hypothetical protein